MKTDYKKEFLTCLNSIDHSKRRYDIFKDFLTATAISFQNAVSPNKNQELENEYKELIKTYKKPEKLAELLHITVQALTQETTDFLGSIYMFGDFGNKHTGQFFTPFHIADFMAQITIYESDLKRKIETEGFMTVCDPCCGSGVFLIAASEVIKKMGYNPQQVLHIDGTDIDKVCCQMAYIQTSLLGLSGVIHYGNTITMQMWEHYKLPMTDINFFRFAGLSPQKSVLFETQKEVIEVKKVEETEERRKNDNQKFEQLSIKFE